MISHIIVLIVKTSWQRIISNVVVLSSNRVVVF